AHRRGRDRRRRRARAPHGQGQGRGPEAHVRGLMAGSVLDSQGMLEAAASLPEQVEEAAGRARGLPGLPAPGGIEHVVVLGMRGSGIAGDIVAAAAGPFTPVPGPVAKSYALPAFATAQPLVATASY